MYDNDMGDRHVLWNLHAAWTQHWAMQASARWTILYNFLVVSTLLILAWAASFGFQGEGWIKKLVLGTFSLIGMLLSIVWVSVAERANLFLSRYREGGQQIEQVLRGESRFPNNTAGPFETAEHLRSGSKTSWLSIRAGHLLIAIPVAFLVIYLILFTVSFVASK
jgi:hypothetical protein